MPSRSSEGTNCGLFARRLDVAPDPLAIARRCWRAGLSYPALLLSSHRSGRSYVAAGGLQLQRELDPEPALGLAPRAGSWGGVPRWIGVLPYEAERKRLERPGFVPEEARPAPPVCEPLWVRYGAVVVVDRTVTVVGDDPVAVAELARVVLEAPECCAGDVRLVHLPDLRAEQQHRERIEAALELIRCGDIYQVNLAHRLRFTFAGNALEVLARLERAAPSPYCSAFELSDGVSLCSTSPELFLRVRADGKVFTRPIKGTRPRGADYLAATSARRDLARDPKEHAELAMVVDLERNDLNRVCRVGSVCAEPPQIEARARVFHREAWVHGHLRPGVGRTEILQALLPSGSVTGAPKVRAMEVIATLEAHRRGVYTGAFGVLAHDGSLELAMNIRGLCMKGEEAEYWVGGGLVAASDPAREVEETRWKSVQVIGATQRVAGPSA